jgi:hypothetical protein
MEIIRLFLPGRTCLEIAPTKNERLGSCTSHSHTDFAWTLFSSSHSTVILQKLGGKFLGRKAVDVQLRSS